MTGSEAAKWKESIESEIQSMYENQVRNYVDLTPDLKTIGCKWIFKKTKDVNTFKSRLVSKGYI